MPVFNLFNKLTFILKSLLRTGKSMNTNYVMRSSKLLLFIKEYTSESISSFLGNYYNFCIYHSEVLLKH